MKVVMLAFLLMAMALTAYADPVITPALGANIVSYEGDKPSDFELGGAAAASLSPHLSAVAGAWYGLGQTYLRGTAGVKITATDVQNENFSIGIGSNYNASSDPDLRPEGWDANATAGWRPFPEKLPNVVTIAQGSYLFSDQDVFLVLGIRYVLKPL